MTSHTRATPVWNENTSDTTSPSSYPVTFQSLVHPGYDAAKMDRTFADLNKQLSVGGKVFLSTSRLSAEDLREVSSALNALLVRVADECLKTSKANKHAVLCSHFDAHITQIWPVIQPHIYFFLAQRADKLPCGLTMEEQHRAADAAFSLLVYLTASLPEMFPFSTTLETPLKGARRAAEDSRLTEVLCRILILEVKDGALGFNVTSRKAAVIDALAPRLEFMEPAADDTAPQVSRSRARALKFLGGKPKVISAALVFQIDNATTQSTSSSTASDKIHQLQIIHRTADLMFKLIYDDAIRTALTADLAVRKVAVALKTIILPDMDPHVVLHQLYALGSCGNLLIKAITSPMAGFNPVLEVLHGGVLSAFAQLSHSSILYDTAMGGSAVAVDFFGLVLPAYLIHPAVLVLAASKLRTAKPSGPSFGEGSFTRLFRNYTATVDKYTVFYKQARKVDFHQTDASRVRAIKCHHRPCTNTNEHEPFKKCSACRNVIYCSKACQQAAWKEHKPECEMFKNTTNKLLPPVREGSYDRHFQGLIALEIARRNGAHLRKQQFALSKDHFSANVDFAVFPPRIEVAEWPPLERPNIPSEDDPAHVGMLLPGCYPSTMVYALFSPIRHILGPDSQIPSAGTFEGLGEAIEECKRLNIHRV